MLNCSTCGKKLKQKDRKYKHGYHLEMCIKCLRKYPPRQQFSI